MIDQMFHEPIFWILLAVLAVGVVAFFAYCIVASGARAENDWRINQEDGGKFKPTPLEKYNADKHQK
jgi:hypothetical protein